MGLIPVNISGGTSFGYKFAIYSSEGSFPASADENSIASVSATAVPDGGLMYRDTFPTVRDSGGALQVGDAVVMVNNGLVFQYTGTSWLSLKTKIFRNGAWELFFDVWEGRGWAANAGFAPANPTVTVNSTSITFSVIADCSAVFRLLNGIDLTPFATIRVRASTTANGSSSYAALHVVQKGVTYYDTNAAATYSFTGTSIVNRDISVSSLNAAYDVVLGAASSDAVSSITFEQVELIF